MKNKIAQIVTLTLLSSVVITGCTIPVKNSNTEANQQGSEDIVIYPEDASEETSEETSEDAKLVEIQPDTDAEIGGKTLKYTYEPAFDSNESGQAIFTYEGKEYKTEKISEFPCYSYVIDYGDDYFKIFYNQAYTNDDGQTTCLVHYPNGEFECLGDVPGCTEENSFNIEENTITISYHVDLFGTYNTDTTYIIGDQGLEYRDDIILFNPINEVTDGSYFDDFTTSDDILTQMKTVRDENGKQKLTLSHSLDLKTEDGQTISLNSGDWFYIVGYSPMMKRFYVEYNGKQAYFEYAENEDYGYTVNGINGNDMFVYLPYAG